MQMRQRLQLERLAERAVQLDRRREDRWQDDQCQEDGKGKDEQHEVPPYNRSSLLPLTEREDRCVDLLRGSQPEERRRVQPVKVRNEAGQRQTEQQDVCSEEIGREQRHLDDLDNKLTSRLAEGVTTKTTTVPASRPPSAVGLVMLELTREYQSDQDLEDGALDGNDGDNAKHGVRGVPELEEPQELKGNNDTDNGENVSNRCHDRTKLSAAVVERRAKEHADQEEDEQDGSVPYDGTEGNDGDTDDGTLGRVS